MLYGVVHYHKTRETFKVLNITLDFTVATKLAFSYACKNLTKEERIISTTPDNMSLHPTNHVFEEYRIVRINKKNEIVVCYPYAYAVVELPNPGDFYDNLKKIDTSLFYKHDPKIEYDLSSIESDCDLDVDL